MKEVWILIYWKQWLRIYWYTKYLIRKIGIKKLRNTAIGISIKY